MKKIYLFFTSLLFLFSAFILASCIYDLGTDNDNLSLRIEPEEKYLTSNTTRKMAMNMAYSDVIDYDFTITSDELKLMQANNPNDLITGKNPILLNAVVGTYSVEETAELFQPIIEMSSSGYGNEPIDNTLYNVEQKRTCYAITQSGGELKSSYYDISVTITDNEAPTYPSNPILTSGISYELNNDLLNDETIKFNLEVTSLFKDNDNDNVVVTYYTDDTFTSQTTVLEVLKQLKQNISFNEDGMIGQLIYVKASDSHNNTTSGVRVLVYLKDTVGPKIYENSTEVTLDEVLKDVNYYAPNVGEYVKNLLLSDKYIIKDDADGVINKQDNVIVSVEGYDIYSTLKVNIYDNNDNSLSFIKTLNKNFIWYENGINSEENPEYGLVCKFIQGDPNNLSIIGPNTSDRYRWKGTDGNNNICIPKTINIYNTEYSVNSLGYRGEGFYDVNCDTLYIEGNPIEKNTISFENSNISYIYANAISFADNKYISTLKIGNSTKDMYIESGIIRKVFNLYVYSNIKYLNAKSVYCNDLYIYCSEDEFLNNSLKFAANAVNFVNAYYDQFK